MSAPFPRVGVGVLVLRDGRVLLGQRLGAHGAGTWQLPGGHLEFGETVADCARREVREETGLILDDVRPGPYSENLFAADRMHYVTVFVIAHCAAGEPQRCEPAKCAGWQWFAWDALPTPLFAPLASLQRTGFVP